MIILNMWLKQTKKPARSNRVYDNLPTVRQSYDSYLLLPVNVLFHTSECITLGKSSTVIRLLPILHQKCHYFSRETNFSGLLYYNIFFVCFVTVISRDLFKQWNYTLTGTNVKNQKFECWKLSDLLNCRK